MATSGSIDYNLTRNNIVRRTLQLLGVLDADEAIQAEDQAVAIEFLNLMIKDWQIGIHDWKESQATLFLTVDQSEYTLGTGGDHASLTTVESTLSADEALGQTVLPITSTTGMTAADNIGIELDDATTQWTTIATVDSTTQVTVDVALTGAASSGNNIYTYTTILDRPLRLIDARIHNDSGTESSLTPLSKKEYFKLTNKTQSGKPSHYYYSPQLTTTGKLYIWPVPDKTEYRLKMTVLESLDDFDAANNNPDLPQEWLLTIIYNLAVILAPMFGKIDLMKKLESRAQYLLEMRRNLEVSDQDIKISPEL